MSEIKKKDEFSDDSKENDMATTEHVPEYDNLHDVCESVRQQAMATIMKWSEAFEESERYDNLYEKRIDELIKEAEGVEKMLMEQKAALRDKLHSLNKTLALVSENEG